MAVGRAACSYARPTVYQYVARRTARYYSAQTSDKIDVRKLIETAPAWDMTEMLPKLSDSEKAITSKQLHHLHRLCALTPPKNADDEKRLIADLSAQLHFVREIQSVDTTGVEPLCSLRDETKAGIQEGTIGLEQLKDAFAREEIRGEYNKKIRRRRGGEKPAEFEWDPLKQASQTVGRYFVVDTVAKDSGDK